MKPTHPAPGSTRLFTVIPVVDVSGLFSADAVARQAVAQELGRAAREVGFLYVTGHGISRTSIDGLRQAAREFFAQPMDWKMDHYIAKSPGHKGYVPQGEEVYGSGANPDRKEALDIGFEADAEHPYVKAGTPLIGYNQWPALPGFRERVSAYYGDVFALGRTLFRGFALALGLPENHFDGMAQCPPSKLRLIHYPYDAQAADAPGMGAHTDYECFTLLLSDEAGLEVMNDEGTWIDTPPLSVDGVPAFVVNIGDMLEVMTAGAFQATAHRVRKVSAERYSFPLFYACDYHTLIQPLPAFAARAGAAAGTYGEISIGEHMWSQALQTYRYLKRKVQSGELKMPDRASPTSSFGHLKKANTPAA